MKRILLPTLSLAGALCLSAGPLAAQPSSFDKREPFEAQYILGVNFVPEWQISHGTMMGGRSYRSFSPNAGLSFEARITRHSGIETGLFYRHVKYPAGKLLDPGAEPYGADYQRYFSIPLLYKYYSRIVNIGVGINYDVMFNQSDKSQDKENRIGILLKVSKDITLYKGLFLEPEFHFNPFWEDGEINHSWIGLALGLKYRF